MKEERYFWVFDPSVLREVRIPEFGWVQLVLLAGALSFLALYLLAAWWLDRRVARGTKQEQREAELRKRLEPAALTHEEFATLRELAGTRRESKLIEFLDDPVAFEVRVHEAHETGGRGGTGALGFIPRLRKHLGYQSDNYFVPLVSTRQLMPGDGVRLSPRDPSRPSHHYGTVERVDTETFTVRLGAAGLDPAELRAPELDLFVMRGQDLEHRFPFLPAGPPQPSGRLVLRHALAPLDQPPRQIRLPLLLEVTFEERAAHGTEADALDPELAPGRPERGVLYDLSDGGFALVARRAHPAGRFLRLIVPLRKPGRHLRLVGRITACRPLRGEHWMIHATLRGLGGKERQFLHQVVLHEQNRRQKTLARIRPRRRKAKAQEG